MNALGTETCSRFGVQPRDGVDVKLRFSLIGGPAPYDRAPPMPLAAGGIAGSQWDDVMFHLARWLVRHLNDPKTNHLDRTARRPFARPLALAD